MLYIEATAKGAAEKRLLQFLVDGGIKGPCCYTSLLKRTPVGHAIQDHDGALQVLEQTSLDWTLAGCNYLGDGDERGNYKTSLLFTGGAKKIYPGDVASFLLKEMSECRFMQKVVGISY